MREKEHIGKRIEWIDIFKGIVIVLMVVGHATGLFNGYIYLFHMSAFFFISGYLCNFEKKDGIYIITNKFFSILLPYITAAMIGMCICYIMEHMGIYGYVFGSVYPGFKYSLSEFFQHGNVYVQFLGALWFLQTLFFIFVMIVIIIFITKKKVSVASFLISYCIMVYAYYIVKYNQNNVMFLGNHISLLVGQFYVLWGSIIFKIAESLKEKNKIVTRTIYIIGWLIAGNVLIYAKNRGLTVDLPSGKINSFILDPIVSSVGIYFIWGISRVLEKTKLIKRICILLGKNTMGILIFHFVFFKIYFLLLHKFGYIEKKDLVNVVLNDEQGRKFWIGLVLFSIIFSLFSWQIIKKIPILNFLFGLKRDINEKICNMVVNNIYINKIRKVIYSIFEKIWNCIDSILGLFRRKRYLMVIAVVMMLLVLLLGVTEVKKNFGTDLKTCEKVKGYYSDGWLQPDSEFRIKTGNSGKLLLNMYCPLDNTKNDKVIKIYINSKLNKTINLNNKDISCEIVTENNKYIDLKIKCNFKLKNNNGDIRNLSVMLNDLRGY